MNKGEIGFLKDTRNPVMYMTEYMQLSAFAANKMYSVSHPFDRRPAFSQIRLKCNISQSTYDSRDETVYIPTDSNTINGIVQRFKPFRVEFMFLNTPGFSLKGTDGRTFATIAKNWKFGLLLIA